MKREDFIIAYAKNSHLEPHHAALYAKLGFLEVAPMHVRVALPCACGESNCSGWVMVSAEHIDHHLTFNAPDGLRRAYLEAVVEEETK